MTRRCGRQAPPVLRHIEIGLIEREWFNERGVFREDGVDLARDGAVDVEARRHEHQLRTLPHGRGRRHGRAHAEGARFVARRSHRTSLGAVADCDGASPQHRIVALLDRRIEGVHVNVDNLAQRHDVTITEQERKENTGLLGVRRNRLALGPIRVRACLRHFSRATGLCVAGDASQAVSTNSCRRSDNRLRCSLAW